MKQLNQEFKKVMEQLRTAQSQIQSMIKNKDLVEEAKKFANQQGAEVKKLVEGDIKKIKRFIDKKKPEIKKLQKTIPAEVKKLQTFVNTQKSEIEKLLKKARRLSKLSKKTAPAKKRPTAKRPTTEAPVQTAAPTTTTDTTDTSSTTA